MHLTACCCCCFSFVSLGIILHQGAERNSDAGHSLKYMESAGSPKSEIYNTSDAINQTLAMNHGVALSSNLNGRKKFYSLPRMPSWHCQHTLSIIGRNKCANGLNVSFAQNMRRMYINILDITPTDGMWSFHPLIQTSRSLAICSMLWSTVGGAFTFALLLRTLFVMV